MTAPLASPDPGEVHRRAYAAFQAAMIENWLDHLTPSEISLLRWVAFNNLRLGRVAGHYHRDNIIGGFRDRETGTMIAEGSGIPGRSLSRAIASLEQRGILTAHRSGRGTYRAGYFMRIYTDVRL